MGQCVHSSGPDTKPEDVTEATSSRIENKGTKRRVKPDDIQWKKSDQKDENNNSGNNEIRLNHPYKKHLETNGDKSGIDGLTMGSAY